MECQKASQKLSVEECFFHRSNFPKNPIFSSPTVKLEKPDFFPEYGNSKWNFYHANCATPLRQKSTEKP